MNKRIVNYDDSKLIWFDFNNLDIKELDSTPISKFDITNMPVEYVGRDILNNPKYSPIYFELENYHVCFFEDSKSKTGYSCMCLNKNRNIYNQNEGYDKYGYPVNIEY